MIRINTYKCDNMENKLINWRVVIILLILSIFGSIAVLPYTLSIQSGIIKELGLSLELVIISSIIQSSILFFVLILIGHIAARKIGLGTPILEKLTKGKKVLKDIKNILPISVGLGILSGALIIALDLAFVYLSGPKISTTTVLPGAVYGFFASFYGAINEEIMLRLFLMSIVILLIRFITKRKEEKVKPTVAWTAIIITAILFGLGHLPLTASITALSPFIITRALILNGVAGIIFGWLYWKKGLESAMISHFSADIVLHVILAAILTIG